eukprot:TRINITY_DN29415_c0_g1_i1.p1 TRINITY_DN29415_c0_g1~~TRINITY_DN29415_c0_g1_i1.p1  ORF type:complete len:201 (-),score=25.92 TRINITY_DN29415_c0_g1_i1:567-1169(-)
MRIGVTNAVTGSELASLDLDADATVLELRDLATDAVDGPFQIIFRDAVLTNDLTLAACGIHDGDHVSVVLGGVQPGTYTFKTEFTIEETSEFVGGEVDHGSAEYELVVARNGFNFTLTIKQYWSQKLRFTGRIKTDEDGGVEFVFDTDHSLKLPVCNHLNIEMDEDGVLLLTDTYDPLAEARRKESSKHVIDEEMFFQGR